MTYSVQDCTGQLSAISVPDVSNEQNVVSVMQYHDNPA